MVLWNDIYFGNLFLWWFLLLLLLLLHHDVCKFGRHNTDKDLLQLLIVLDIKTVTWLLPSFVPAASLLHNLVKCSSFRLSHSCVVLGLRCLFSSWWHEKEAERQRQKEEERDGRVKLLRCGLLLSDLSDWCSSFDKYSNVSMKEKLVCKHVWQSGKWVLK